MTIPKCTSRPDCECSFCISVRTGISEKVIQDAMAERWILDYCRLRDREVDREALAAGRFESYPGDLVEVAAIALLE